MKNTKLQNPSLRKRKGFTLIELIVVIAILAILAAIAIPTFVGTLARANDRTTAANQRIIASAVSIYVAENGALPDADTDLVGYLVGLTTDAASDTINEVFDGDPTGADYTVTYAATSVTIAADPQSATVIPSIVING